jgi:hypothetical protein
MLSFSTGTEKKVRAIPPPPPPANGVLSVTVFERGRSTLDVSLFAILIEGGRDAVRDFYGAVGSKSTVGGRSPSVEYVPVHTVQSKDPIHLEEH